MNTLRILKKLCSRFYWKDLFLFVTLALMVIFTNIITQPVQTFLNARRQIRDVIPLDYESTLHFDPSYSLLFSSMGFTEERSYHPEVHEAIRNCDGVRAVLEMYSGGASCQEGGGTFNFQMYLYSQSFASYIPPWPEAGRNAEGTEGRLPVMVSPAAADMLPVGTAFDLEMVLTSYEDVKELSVPCVAAGILSPERALPRAGVDNKSLGAIGLAPEYWQDAPLVAAVYDPAFFGEIPWDYPAIIVPEKDADRDALRARLGEALGTWGEVRDLAQIERNVLASTLSESLPEQLKFLLLALIAIFGYGAYLFLAIRQRERQFAVFYIAGMTKKRMFTLNMLFNVVLYLLAAAVGWVLTPWVAKSFVHVESYTGAGLLGTLCTGGLFLVTLLMSLTASFIQNRNAAAITLYHKGD